MDDLEIERLPEFQERLKWMLADYDESNYDPPGNYWNEYVLECKYKLRRQMRDEQKE